jgi:hypothetical protein
MGFTFENASAWYFVIIHKIMLTCTMRVSAHNITYSDDNNISDSGHRTSPYAAAPGNNFVSSPGRAPLVCYYCNNPEHTRRDWRARLSTRSFSVLQGNKSAPWLQRELPTSSGGKSSTYSSTSIWAVNCQNLWINAFASRPLPCLRVELRSGPVEALLDWGSALLHVRHSLQKAQVIRPANSATLQSSKVA